MWLVSTCRNSNYGFCSHHHSCDWVWCTINPLELRTDGLDCRTNCTLAVCLVYSVHLETVGRLLPLPWFSDREAKLHLHGCGQSEPVKEVVLALRIDAVQWSGWHFDRIHHYYCNCSPVRESALSLQFQVHCLQFQVHCHCRTEFRVPKPVSFPGSIIGVILIDLPERPSWLNGAPFVQFQRNSEDELLPQNSWSGRVFGFNNTIHCNLRWNPDSFVAHSQFRRDLVALVRGSHHVFHIFFHHPRPGYRQNYRWVNNRTSNVGCDYNPVR